MNTVRVTDGEIVKNDGGVVGRKLYDAPEAVVIHLELEVGGSVEPHATPVDMEFYVIEGKGRFFLGDESVEAGAGTLIPSPRNVPHGMRNIGPGALRVLAMKNPRP